MTGVQTCALPICHLLLFLGLAFAAFDVGWVRTLGPFVKRRQLAPEGKEAALGREEFVGRAAPAFGELLLLGDLLLDQLQFPASFYFTPNTPRTASRYLKP